MELTCDVSFVPNEGLSSRIDRAVNQCRANIRAMNKRKNNRCLCNASVGLNTSSVSFDSPHACLHSIYMYVYTLHICVYVCVRVVLQKQGLILAGP